ncbi:MAG TPA: cupin-like domain-containing protein [Oligoflexus sp.]|uniref:cupin-like domain-containing protein n=1 Tax=Oligoflexus sp. TaxID=1971216 RepID=UPI002D286931|nr:cupin-like domain-containing protein [Oligoflexus sp.]HYX35607.1 cupin-like domain-containing protein [Oligoflexus sp.]
MLIDRVRGIPYQDFLRLYVLPRKPVLIEGAIDHWQARQWTPENLAERLYQTPIRFRSEQGNIEGLCGPLIERVLSGQEPGLYLRNIDLSRDLPQLIPDVTPNLNYARTDWRSTRLLPHHWLVRPGLQELFIGGKGTKFPVLHVDYWGMDAFLSQIYGEKELILFGPDQSPYLYQNQKNPLLSDINHVLEPDRERFPLFGNANPIKLIMKPGDTVYNPNGWWHTTQTNELSITIIQAVWNRANWPILIGELKRTARDRSWIQTAVMIQYLHLLKPWLLLREKWHEHLLQ